MTSPHETEFRAHLARLGYGALPETALALALPAYEALVAQGRPDDEEVEAAVDDAFARAAPRARLVSMSCTTGTDHHATARLTLEVEGREASVEATGRGAVHAAFDAIRQAAPHEAKLSQFWISATGAGPDAPALATIRLEEHGRIVEGRGKDLDTVVAAAQAFLQALNKLASKRETPTEVSSAFLAG